MIAIRTDRLTDEQRDLAASEVGMAMDIARRFARRCGEPDREAEFISAAHLGLIKAARNYDSSRGFQFRTFAQHKIRGEILSMLRLRGKPRRRFAAFLGDDDIWEVEPRPEAWDEMERFEAFTYTLRGLPSRWQAILVDHYLGGLSITEAGARLGLTISRASAIHTQAIVRLREDGRGEELRELCGG